MQLCFLPGWGGGGCFLGGGGWWRPPGTATAAGGTHPTGMHSFPRFYWPKRSFGQGNIFTPVCHSVHGGGGRGSPSLGGVLLARTPSRPNTPHLWQGEPPPDQTPHPPWHGEPPQTRHHTPPQSRPPLEQTPPPGWRTPPEQTPPPPREADSGIRSTIGRYASYWNAFLFCIKIAFSTPASPSIEKLIYSNLQIQCITISPVLG